VLHGEDDPFFPIGNGEALAAEIPDARLVRLGRAGHRLPAHAAPIVAEELIAHGGLTGQPPDHDRSVR
jgi:pimeloyl-ACP methyl ester carboxylesterase